MYSRLSKIALSLSALASVPSYSVEVSENIDLSGFVAVGQANYRSYFDHDMQWHREWHTIKEGGLTLSASLPYGLEFNAQGLYRNLGGLSFGSDSKIDYASIDWRYPLLGIGEQTISIGRIKSGGGIYNHTRDVPFTRPSVLLPNSVYNEGFRSVYAHIDGVRLASDFFVAGGDLRMEFAFGSPNLGEQFIGNAYASKDSSKWREDGAYYFDMRYQNAQWLVTYSRTNVDALLNGKLSIDSIHGIPVNYMGTSELNLISDTFGLQYQSQDFELTGEYSKQKVDAKNEEYNTSLVRDIDGYYLQLEYYLMPQVSVLGRYEKLNFDINWDLPSHTPIGLLNSKQYTFGVNWRINTDWLLNVELHRNRTDYWTEELGLLELAWRF